MWTHDGFTRLEIARSNALAVLGFDIFKFLKGSNLTVAFKLQLVNLLVIFSSLCGILGVIEIHNGAVFHDLNYKHSKYIAEFVREADRLDGSAVSLAMTRDAILNIREQPVRCLAQIGPLDKLTLRAVDTYDIITVCEDDIIAADELLMDIERFRNKEIPLNRLKQSLLAAQETFTYHSDRFQVLVTQTVDIIFGLVLAIMIAKGVIIPLIGWLLSLSVSRDYQKLSSTQTELRDERDRSTMIEAEKLASLQRLVAGVAHEVNTPVGICVTASSHLNDECVEFHRKFDSGTMTRADMIAFLDLIRQSTVILNSNLDRASNLVRSFKRVAVDQSSREQRQINIKTYLQEILLSLQPRLKSTKIAVEINCPDDLDAVTDPGSIAQIITNLVENSIIHAFDPNDTGTIRISVSNQPPVDPGMIRFTYSDDGKGMDEPSQASIYDPFFTTKRGEGGTGLGMHILFNLVTQTLGGRISCKSVLGHGTVFNIEFEDRKGVAI